MGHSLIYTEHIEKAAHLNGWNFKALLPYKTQVNPLKVNWDKGMKCPTVRHWYLEIEGKPYRRPPKRIRALNRISYHLSLLQNLRTLIKKSSDKSYFLFYEAFALSDIEVLANVLRFLPSKNIQVGLVHRYQRSTLGSEVEKYNLVHQKIRKSGVKLHLFTDSDLLKTDLDSAFNEMLHVLPIHYIERDLYSKKELGQKIVCWWPGLPRDEKGFQIVKSYSLSSHEDNASIELVCSREAELKSALHGPSIASIDSHLSRTAYLSWFKKSDVILLPYNAPHYQNATSSIFIEAIIAGKIPLVYPGTWMAYELEKRSLSKLVITWVEDQISSSILNVVRDEDVIKDLEKMRQEYLKFHSLEGYARILKEKLLS